MKQAIGVFSDHGFEGTSTEVLLKAMGISRQSMYDTFGDKWTLYLEALQGYVTESVASQISVLNGKASPIKGVEALLENMIQTALASPAPACLGISAICEFGHSEREVTLVTEISGRALRSALETRISEAVGTGEAPADLVPAEAAQFILATLTGIKVAARAGASSQVLQGIARTALRSLR
ncbi:AcrR family transcriptional regulator [Neorhizobium galegae]|uniref:TetR/AcrR family transcriptional regulator n=1 Tax=Neorhizobium galegae TaxID=399 RepID=UPI002789161D|nr:TetR/AcrR family transcriptional regulator [Neorhizobium galegae]MDQ0135027.1 AcrR family transcriptional regulator [Neorhizobium galegae]